MRHARIVQVSIPCQERFLWTHEGLDFASQPVVGIVLQVGDSEKFTQALGYEGLDPFLRVNEQGPCFEP